MTPTNKLSVFDWMVIALRAVAAAALLLALSVISLFGLAAGAVLVGIPVLILVLLSGTLLVHFGIIPDELGWLVVSVPALSVIVALLISLVDQRFFIAEQPLLLSFVTVGILVAASYGYHVYNPDDVPLATKIAWYNELAQLQKDYAGDLSAANDQQERAAVLAAKLRPYMPQGDLLRWSLAAAAPFTPNEALTTLYFGLWANDLTESSFLPWRVAKDSMKAAAPAVLLLTYVLIAGVMALGIRNLWTPIGAVLMIRSEPSFVAVAAEDIGCGKSTLWYLIERFGKAIAIAAVTVALSSNELQVGQFSFVVKTGVSALVALTSSTMIDAMSLILMGILIRCSVRVEFILWDQLLVIALGGLLSVFFDAELQDILVGLVVSTVPVVVAHSWERRTALNAS